jgi:hypothetical protein
MHEGLGFGAKQNRTAVGDSMAKPDSVQRKGIGLTGEARSSARREGSGVPLRRRGRLGRGLQSGLGWFGPPRPFFYCSFLFLFLIPYFFYNFCKKGTKSIQTNF